MPVKVMATDLEMKKHIEAIKKISGLDIDQLDYNKIQKLARLIGEVASGNCVQGCC